MKIKINEIFKSIQGEGIESGLPTIFIRTTGCNLRCAWCDTKYAYNRGEEMTITEIIDRCGKLAVKRICLTGGEPLINGKKVIELVKRLIKQGFSVSIETNGSVDVSVLPKKAMVSLDIKCPSSKMCENMLYENLDFLKKKDQVKFIISDLKDYNFAKKIVKKHKLENKTNVIFQPVFKKDRRFVKDLVDLILKDELKIRVSLQLHKIIWGNKRGV
jgi:7-carboxy-7-deazaguanine synthase